MFKKLAALMFLAVVPALADGWQVADIRFAHKRNEDGSVQIDFDARRRISMDEAKAILNRSENKSATIAKMEAVALARRPVVVVQGSK